MSVPKVIAQSLVTAALALVLIGAGTQVASALGVLANASAADQDFKTVATIQSVSTQTDELYAPTIDSLRDGTFTYALPTTKGRGLSYAVSQDRTHYVIAEQLSNGTIRIASDSASAVTCASYSAQCLAKVTSSPDLLAAIVPTWITF